MKYAAFQFRHYGRGVRIFDHCTILRPEVISLGDGVRIDDYTKIEGGQGVTIGANVHIASFCHINGGGGEVVLGAHSAYASGAKIIGGQPDLSYRHISPVEPADLRHTLRYRTEIGEYAIVFTNAVIVAGVTVGEGAVVAAGAVVNSHVAPWTIVAGVPAKFAGWREVITR